MKVCHLTSVHPGEDIRILIKECQTLQRAGHEVFLIVVNEESRQYNGVQIIGVKSGATNRISQMMKGPSKVYQAALELNADVYHFHDPELIPIGLMLKRKGKKVIYDVHEDVPEQVMSKHWIPSILRKPISKTVKGIESFASKRFDAIVPATPTIANRFKQYNKNTVTVHNFPILNELIDDEIQEISEEKTEQNIIYIGRITVVRGINEMTKAMEIVNESTKGTLFLAGKFAPESLKNDVEKMKGWQYIDHLGWLSRDEVKSYLAKSQVGLVVLYPEPRHIVSYPIKLFEYMSAGIPVIASNFPLWESIIEDAQCGICVDPLNPQEIADAIIKLLENPQEAKQMGLNGRKAVVEKYSWETESENLISLYDRLK